MTTTAPSGVVALDDLLAFAYAMAGEAREMMAENGDRSHAHIFAAGEYHVAVKLIHLITGLPAAVAHTDPRIDASNLSTESLVEVERRLSKKLYDAEVEANRKIPTPEEEAELADLIAAVLKEDS